MGSPHKVPKFARRGGGAQHLFRKDPGKMQPALSRTRTPVFRGFLKQPVLVSRRTPSGTGSIVGAAATGAFAIEGEGLTRRPPTVGVAA